jgi:hypothetical protein
MAIMREGAKSTVGEEEIILDACFQNFHNAMIVGETFDRAADRLRAIKHEFEYNDFIIELFGGMKGATWNEDKIILQNGICIQAKGRDQSFRGIKHLDWRPDFLWTDDFEDKESVKTPESRKYWLTVFMTVILPALDKRARVRITGTPLDEDCMLYNLRKEKMRDGKQRWTTREYPIEYRDAKERRAHADLARALSAGAHRQPARLLRRTGADARVHDGVHGASLQPRASEIQSRADARGAAHPHLAADARGLRSGAHGEKRNVVHDRPRGGVVDRDQTGDMGGRRALFNARRNDQGFIRVEERIQPDRDWRGAYGLNEWIMQPLRHEQTRRRVILPMRALDAPKGKIDFIGSLQPFFQAHEVEFAVECPELKKQLLSFPTGRLDAPNALAYMLKMRPGLPMLDGFGHLHVIEDLPRARGRPFYLALNADLGLTTAVLCQHVDGALWVLADWVREGDPGEVMKGIMTDASIEVAATPRPVIGAKHFRQFDTVGLVPAVKKQIVDILTGGDLIAGRDELRKRMQQMIHSQPGLLVSTKATWTLRALAGGYAHVVVKGGMLSGEAVKNHYRVVMEGLEAFAGLLPQTANDDMDRAPHFAVNERGIRYMTALPQGR